MIVKRVIKDSIDQDVIRLERTKKKKAKLLLKNQIPKWVSLVSKILEILVS